MKRKGKQKTRRRKDSGRPRKVAGSHDGAIRPGKPPQAAIYTRVSKEDQVRGYSLDDQLDRLRKFSHANGMGIYDEFVDAGHSGTTIKRPQYRRMMEERAKWDVLLVLKLDRIHRNALNCMMMKRLLDQEGKVFRSATEYFDFDTAMGRYYFDNTARLAQLEAEIIGERAGQGIRYARSVNGKSTGRRGYGYRPGPDGPAILEMKEVKVLQRMFAMLRRGMGREDIARALNAKRVKPPRGKSWTGDMVLWLLREPRNTGARISRSNPTLGVNPAIFTRREFREILRLLKVPLVKPDPGSFKPTSYEWRLATYLALLQET